jgi:hypothetical protein
MKVKPNLIIDEDSFYNIMCSWYDGAQFDVNHQKWMDCFNYYLTTLGYNNKSIESLFYDFEMCNWTAMHIENTRFKEMSPEQLVLDFTGECEYICDRMSLDRLFRTHWVFRQAYKCDLDRISYPLIYKD